MNEQTTPGIHPDFRWQPYSQGEQSIIEKFGTQFFVTRGGQDIWLSENSNYRYFLIKPTEMFFHMFNLEREIVVVFSSYAEFQPRSLEAYQKIQDNFAELRLEKICFVLISAAANVVSEIRSISKERKESRITIPFTYSELLSGYNDFLFRNRFKDFFYSRDLFAYESPLKTDLYFFGREQTIHNLISRSKSGENSALFGLRKTGKTSVVHNFVRALKVDNRIGVFIDCQSPSFHQRRWYGAIYYVLSELARQADGVKLGASEELFTETRAAELFEEKIFSISKAKQMPIVLIFDEIENITFNISPSSHWCSGMDFIYFWQAMRAAFQKNSTIFTYVIVGTNPTCVEKPMVQGKDNPIYNQVPYDYIPGFTFLDTREMVRKLGRFMGLRFDETIYAKLTEDFGGHPFLIRHVCSEVNKLAPAERPYEVLKPTYEKAKSEFSLKYSNYIEMILNVLLEFFNDEYEMLKMLALGDLKGFNEFADHSPEFTNHLVGYGVIGREGNSYFFKIESIKAYLLQKIKTPKLISVNDRQSEISAKRNPVEAGIRRLVHTILKSNLGETRAAAEIRNHLKTKPPRPMSSKEMLDGASTPVYFDDLRRIVLANYPMFQIAFGLDKSEFDQRMNFINKHRVDAHAKTISEADCLLTLNYLSHFQKVLDDIL